MAARQIHGAAGSHPLYESFGGIHHVYANAKALAAMKAGKPHPDGAVLVFDLMVLAAMSACARNQHAPVFNAHADAGVQSVTAQGIYEEWGCGTCHGAGGAGSPQGPALKNLAAHWRRETLLRYLKAQRSCCRTRRR